MIAGGRASTLAHEGCKTRKGSVRMSESYRALTSDFYVNLKLQVKMDLPRSRETVLDLFERLRRQYPTMSHFRRYKDELALESTQNGSEAHRWVAVRSNSIRAGSVNTETIAHAYTYHKQVLEAAPFYLNVSPIDIEYVELLYGFDIMAGGNHDAIVYEALYEGSPLAGLGEHAGLSLVDCQPMIGFTIPDEKGELQVHFEVKTHPTTTKRDADATAHPISIYLALRRFGSVHDIHELGGILDELARHGEELLEARVIPKLVIPIRHAAGLNT